MCLSLLLFIGNGENLTSSAQQQLGEGHWGPTSYLTLLEVNGNSCSICGILVKWIFSRKIVREKTWICGSLHWSSWAAVHSKALLNLSQRNLLPLVVWHLTKPALDHQNILRKCSSFDTVRLLVNVCIPWDSNRHKKKRKQKRDSIGFQYVRLESSNSTPNQLWRSAAHAYTLSREPDALLPMEKKINMEHPHRAACHALSPLQKRHCRQNTFSPTAALFPSHTDQ